MEKVDGVMILRVVSNKEEEEMMERLLCMLGRERECLHLAQKGEGCGSHMHLKGQEVRHCVVEPKVAWQNPYH